MVARAPLLVAALLFVGSASCTTTRSSTRDSVDDASSTLEGVPLAPLPPSQVCSVGELVGNWTGSLLGMPGKSASTRMEVRRRDEHSLFLLPPTIGRYQWRAQPDPLTTAIATLLPNGTGAVWCPPPVNSSVQGGWCSVIYRSLGRNHTTTRVYNRTLISGSWKGGPNCSSLTLRNPPGLPGTPFHWCNHFRAAACPEPPLYDGVGQDSADTDDGDGDDDDDDASAASTTAARWKQDVFGYARFL